MTGKELWVKEWERLKPAVRRYLQQLERLIDGAFVREDLSPLCQVLGVDADQVLTEEKQTLVRFLLLTMTGQQRLEELIEELGRRRPRVDWPAVPEEVKLTAEELLAAMPVEEIPAVGRLPEGSRMPLTGIDCLPAGKRT